MRGETQILELRPTVPVLCSSSFSCALTLVLEVPDHYKNDDCEITTSNLPFSEQNCGVYIAGHIDGTDIDSHLSTPNNLTVYGKVMYQIGGIDTRTFFVKLRVPQSLRFRDYHVWEGFSINTTVSYIT